MALAVVAIGAKHPGVSRCLFRPDLLVAPRVQRTWVGAGSVSVMITVDLVSSRIVSMELALAGLLVANSLLAPVPSSSLSLGVDVTGEAVAGLSGDLPSKCLSARDLNL